MSIRITNTTTAIPAPTGGLNARDNLDAMEPTDAISLINLIPRNNYIESRGGYASHSTGMTSSVEWMHSHSESSGSEKLLAAANGNLWDCSSASAATSLKSGLSSNQWVSTTLDNITVLVNGTDQPQRYTIAGGMVDAVFTGSGLSSDNSFTSICNYRGQLFFGAGADIWYGSDGAVSGTVTKFPVGRVFQRGGFIQWIQTWTRDTGSSSDDVLVIASSKGEIYLYTGYNPAAADWKSAGRFFLGKPLGRRSFFHIGPDLVVITNNGAYPLSAVLAIGQSNAYNAVSDKISQAFSEAGKLYGANFGWMGVNFEQGQIALVNIPISTTQSIQYVLNPQNGSWCEFSNMNALSWLVHADELYFGTAGGIIYKAFSGLTDDANAIPIDCKWAYNYFNSRGDNKRVLEATLVLTVSDSITMQIGCDTDFQFAGIYVSTVLTNSGGGGSGWNTNNWNTFFWSAVSEYVRKPVGLSNIGKAISFGFSASLESAAVRCTSLQVSFELGGGR